MIYVFMEEENSKRPATGSKIKEKLHISKHSRGQWCLFLSKPNHLKSTEEYLETASNQDYMYNSLLGLVQKVLIKDQRVL